MSDERKSTFFGGPVIEGEWAELLVEEACTRRDLDDYTVHPGFTVLAGFHDDVIEEVCDVSSIKDEEGRIKEDATIMTRQIVCRRAFFIVGKSVNTKLDELHKIVEKERDLRREAGADVAEMEDRIKGLEVERDEAIDSRKQREKELGELGFKQTTAVEHAKKQSEKLTEQQETMDRIKAAIGDLQWNQILNEDLPF